MSLVTWNPFAEMESMLERMMGEFPLAEFPRLTLPAFDLYEQNGKYVMELAVPGYDPKDISVEVNGNVVTVSGKHSESAEKKDAKYHRREIRKGSFTRTIALPQDIDPNDVDAKISQGILTLTLTPTKPIAPKRIEIKGS